MLFFAQETISIAGVEPDGRSFSPMTRFCSQESELGMHPNNPEHDQLHADHHDDNYQVRKWESEARNHAFSSYWSSTVV